MSKYLNTESLSAIKTYIDVYAKDVLEYSSLVNFPLQGKEQRIYIALDTNLMYRWDTNSYVLIGGAQASEIVVEGYYFANVFWKESSHLNRLADSIQRLYVDVPTKEIYYYSSTSQSYYKILSVANSQTPGISKLYSDTGNNVDGSITQKVITEKLKNKVEFDTSQLSTTECLDVILNKA